MAGQGSARVTLKEIDLSQVRSPGAVQPSGVPAAVVGPAQKGPAFVPKTVANIQQFNETFGSMLDRSEDGNSNLFGPLAMEQWLRNSQAGTFIRTLGVGDGTKNYTNAGFVVGDKQVQNVLPNINKNANNNYATGTELARTMVLGNFMLDKANSNYLKEAGIEVDNAQSQITVNFGTVTKVQIDGSIIFLTDTADSTRAYGFDNNGGAVNGADVTIDVQALNTTAAIAAAFHAAVNGDNGNHDLTSTYVAGETVVTIEQDTAGAAGNTEVKASFNLPTLAGRDVITITGDSVIKNSTVGDTIRMEGGGVNKATIEITIKDLAANANLTSGNLLKLVALKADRTSTDEVILTFKNDADFLTGGGVDNEVFDPQGGDTTLNVRIGDNGLHTLGGQKETLFNLAEAINGANDTQLAGLLTATLSADKQTLTIEQVTPGNVDNTVDAAIRCTAKITFTAGTFSLNGTAATGGEDAEHFTGGTDGDGTITFNFTDQPAVGDNFTIIALDTTSEEFIFVANQGGGVNGNNPDGTVRIELGNSLDNTMQNIRNAIEVDASSINAKVVTTHTANSVTITQVTAGTLGDTLVTFNLRNVATANTASSSLVGNFGEKTTNFGGGGGGANPLVRGLLMLPQGARASLDVQVDRDTGDYNKLSDYTAPNTDIRGIATPYALNFDNGASNDSNRVAGYMIGQVDNESFTIILNGFSNTVEPVSYQCSFDPDSPSYFAKVLNTDPTKIEEKGHYLYAHWDVKTSIASTNNSSLLFNNGTNLDANASYDKMLGFLTQSKGTRNATDTNKPNYEGFNSKFKTAKTPWFVSQFFAKPSDTARHISNVALTTASGEAKKLFRLYMLDDGAVGNKQFRVLISGLRKGVNNSYGSFDLALETFDGDSVSGDVVAEWKNLSFDPDSINYIARVIGDQHTFFNFDADENRQRLVTTGNYPIKNKYVRVELDQGLIDGSHPISCLPAGFQGPSYLNTKLSGNFAELGDNGSGNNKIFSGSPLNNVQVTPLNYVRSISRNIVEATYEADQDLSWGIKFANKENVDTDFRENSELVHNKSLESWTKYYPTTSTDSAYIEDGSLTDVFQNNFFSLEKICAVTTTGDAAGDIIWDGALYSRNGQLISSTNLVSDRFVDFDRDLNVVNKKYLKFRCLFQGGFDGVNIFDKEKSNQSNLAAWREANEEVSGSITGPTIAGYKKALDVLADKSAAEFQLLIVPGIREPQVTDYAISACENRFDALYLMDVLEYSEGGLAITDDVTNVHVRQTINSFEKRILDTSFAAAYFPNVLIRKPSNNSPIEVPPSVVMLGALSRNDIIADPWFAPAGLSRGLLRASNSMIQMNRDLLNELYDADINPIYEPAGRAGEVYAFGQKTLLQDQSALDRINVRRLLIHLRRRVKNIANTLLFEPNRASTLQRFSALVEPILEEVKQRQGVERYKVKIDSSTTTQNDVENNTIRGKIFLQPTKSVEFISLDFVVTNSINQ